jgi:2-polyprenyl-3-methyl-5-hydroxy-6-metoxy-1,4-benzoquinol methylase
MKLENEFDEKAMAWDDDPQHAKRAQTIAKAIGEEIPNDPSLTAMEYGCGTGLLGFPLRDRFSKITLIDSSKGMLEVLKEKIAKSAATNMEALNVDLLESPNSLSITFSVIYSAMVLHHIPDIGKMLSTWHSLLAHPGYLFIADLDSDKGLFHGPEFKGHNGFDRNDLQKIAGKAGFVEVKFRTVSEINKTASDGVQRTFPLFLMTCKK